MQSFLFHLDLIINKKIRGIENEHVLKPYIPFPYLKETNDFVTILEDSRGLSAVLLLIKSLKSIHKGENRQ